MLTKDPKSLVRLLNKMNVMSKKQINSLIDNNVPVKIFYGSHVDYLQALQGLSNSKSDRNAHVRPTNSSVALSSI